MALLSWSFDFRFCFPVPRYRGRCPGFAQLEQAPAADFNDVERWVPSRFHRGVLFDRAGNLFAGVVIFSRQDCFVAEEARANQVRACNSLSGAGQRNRTEDCAG